jgi:hypothetical protein
VYLSQPTCLVSEAPTKPEIVWELCYSYSPARPENTGEQIPCLSLDNARNLVLYLHAVDQWIEETNTLCGE